MLAYFQDSFEELCEFPNLTTWRALALLILADYAIGGSLIGFAYITQIAVHAYSQP